MKSKILKVSLIIIGIILIILGISSVVQYDVFAIQGSAIQSKASTSTLGVLVEGEKDPNNYKYNIYTASEWEASTYDNEYGTNTWIPTYGDVDIYCITPGISMDYYINNISYSEAKKLVGKTYSSSHTNYYGHASTPSDGYRTFPIYQKISEELPLPVAAAYIVSDYPIGRWTLNKQRAIWNLSDELNEGLVTTINDGSNFNDESTLDTEVVNYAEYDSSVRDVGLQPTDKTSLDSVYTQVNQTTGNYTVGPFNVEYTNGIYGNIAFSGISNITVIGYNKAGEKVRDNIEVDKLILKDTTTEIYGEAKEPQYFEPSEDLKVDKAEQQVYPLPGQDFKVVFKDPNSGLSADDENRVEYVSIKVEFKYMLANGQYIKLRGVKYTVSYTPHNDRLHIDYCYSKCPYEKYICEGEYCIQYEAEKKLCTGHWNDCKGHIDYSCERTCYLDYQAQQDIMAADAIRSIYKQEIEIGKENKITIGMEIGGNVWEDIRDNSKETELDGIQDPSSEGPVGFIPVILHIIDSEKTIKGYTNDKGEYSFTGLDAMKKYYVEFQYNGQTYENTIYTNNLEGGYSNATESMTERDNFNKDFAEIPGEKEYTLDQVTYNDGNKDYTPDAPFAISAYTGSNGDNNPQTYPKYDVFVISETDEVVNGVTYQAIYDKEEDDSQKEVDFGITKRIEFDMALKQDIYIATVKVNGKTQVYGYDAKNLGANDGDVDDTWNIEVVDGYERGIDNSDYNFTGQNGNKDELLEVYVTYKIAVRNQSQSIIGEVTKLYDYYDGTYEYVEELSWKSNTNYTTDETTLNNLQDSMEKGIVEKVFNKKEKKTEDVEQVKATDNKNRILEINVGKKQQKGETVYLYLTFKIKGEGSELSLGEKSNLAEIGEFKTYYATGTKLPHYGGKNDYEIKNDNVIAGRVDKDSIPDTLKQTGIPQEDDEDEAPGLNVHLTGESRKLNGTVWEDKRTQKSGDSVIGNGLRDNGEIGIAGVTVQLAEKMENGFCVWQTAVTNEKGEYSFEGYVAGDYVIRFFYGESIDTVATKADGGKNDVSYNGQDFKSTSYQVGVKQNKTTDLDGKYQGYTNAKIQNESGSYGYDIAAAESKKVSDAKDIWSRRQEVNGYSTENVTNDRAEVLASPYSGNDSLLDTLRSNTYMLAETGVIVVEIEKNTQSKTETEDVKFNPSYSLIDIDFGLTERPKAQLEIDKSISNIKVTLANNSVLFDTNKSATDVIWQDHEEYNLASKKQNGKYEDYYGDPGKNRYSYRTEVNNIVKKADNGLIQLTMDEELMHGATIQITYKVKVTNVGEVDYVGQSFYYTGKNGTVETTTRADQVVDYVANNLQFNASTNNRWNVISKTTLKNGLIKDSLDKEVDKFNNIIQTIALSEELEPGESTEETLVLTQLISSENTSDNLTYSNIVEIVKTSNTVGRRMAYSIVGNQNPSASEASEVDASVAERVIILPPFGDTHIFYILIAAVGIILVGGIALIIRKVLKK